ncbi:post-transcriptional regulator [Peribacillus kribbensis]|uniref:post-transcriptional regulator n=1 Tax=Peribacillus kribbensis TaxID=356658 RepID=UPI0003F8AAC0|nr:post-transcriptional regulator [Peribacillus kribbensis]
MSNQHPYDHFKENVMPALESKADEYSLLGYGEVSVDEIWLFLTKKKWKAPKEEKRLFEVVEDILSLTAVDFMNFAVIEAYKQPSLLTEEGKEELKDLLS